MIQIKRDKPDVKKVTVVFRSDGQHSKSMTLYDTTVEKAFAEISKLIDSATAKGAK